MKLEKSNSTYSIEETMDPPSFIKNICKEKLEIPEEEIQEVQKLLEEKAFKFEQ